MNLLLVDDRPLNLKLLRVVFQAEGHQTVDASDGLDALEKLAERRFDAVITDILMPNMDGYRLCRTIREDPRLNHLALVIYTSTYVSAGDRELAEQAGADEYLTKPSPAQELMAAVTRAQDKRKNTLVTTSVPVEQDFLRQYNETLVHKLEERNLDLEEQARLLNESQRKFRTLVENLKAVFFLTGEGGRPVHYVSPAYEAIWGRSCESLYRDPDSWLHAIVGDDRPLVSQALDRSRSGLDLEFRLQTETASPRWVRLRTVPALNPQGHSEGICGFAEDITPLKMAEFQFQQAQKMEGIGRLAGGVAHDFNNILTAIYGFNTLSGRKIGPDHPAQKDVKMVEKLVGRAAKLTHQLLAFSRKQIIEPRVVDLGNLLDGLVRMLGPILGEDIELRVQRADQAFHVRIDPGQMEQVLMNLCVNSRDAMPTGGRLTLSLGRDLPPNLATDPGPGNWIVLGVEDTGTGMDAATLEHAFEPFFTTKGMGVGTGLGLATSYGIVTQSGGRLMVTSEVGQGAKFTILLPESADSLSQVPESAAVIFPPGTETILVVDDDADVASSTVQALTAEGFQVRLAHSADEAVSLVASDLEKKIRLVLTDVVMPQRGGKELAEDLARTRPDISILFTSGYTDDSIIRRGVAVQAINFLRKPFTPRELVMKVHQVLEEPASPSD